MITLEIQSYGFNYRMGNMILQSETNSISGDEDWSGKCLAISNLPNIEEFNNLTERFHSCEFIILPNFSHYSHFGANIWKRKIPVLTLNKTDFSFIGNEILFVDFNSEKLYLSESRSDTEFLKEKYSALVKGTEDNFGNINQSNLIEILGEVSSLAEIDYSFSMGANGIGVLKAELFYSNGQMDLSKINQIKQYHKTYKESFPLLIRFFDYEITLKNSQLWTQPTKYLGYRGVRILEIENIWLDKFIQLLNMFETNNIIPILPMVTSANEVIKFKKAISQKYEKVGVTVETPAAALAINELLKVSSFIEIGLNDLTQYTMAWDRDIPNEGILPTTQIQSSVNLLIERIVKSCYAQKIDYALGLDLKPSLSLAVNLNQIGVTKISCSPYLIKHWLKSFQELSSLY